MKYKLNGEWIDVNIKALDSMVIGSIIQFMGTTIPTGWLECNGGTITQSEYPELYALIGGTLPDFRGRVLVGQDTSQTEFDTLGETGGEKKHLLTSAESGLRSHKHEGINWQGNETGSENITLNGGGSNGYVLGYQGGASTSQGRSIQTYNVSNYDALNSHNNLQPYAVVKHIIKAKNTTPTMASVVNTQSDSTEDTYSCDYINGKIGEVLWTNLNPAGEFAAQTIQFSGTYNYYDIISWVDGVTYETTRVYLNKRTIMQIMEGGFIRTRYATATSNSVEFSKGTFYQSYSSGADNNYQVIPYQIIGYK